MKFYLNKMNDKSIDAFIFLSHVMFIMYTNY